jgi:hypothetical protein
MRITLYCIICTLFFSFFFTKANDFKSAKIEKKNISKVTAVRQNSYGYSGGMIDTYNSNRGIILVEFIQPINSWSVYIFDLNTIDSLNSNAIFEEYERFNTVLNDESQQEVYIVQGDTLYDSELADRVYSRRIATIDTLSFVDYIIDTAILSGQGTLPQLITHNYSSETGDHIVHYMRLNDKIKSWEDCCLYRYALIDDCTMQYSDGFIKITLPTATEQGYVDTIKIRNILVNALNTNKNDNVPYDCVEGYLIFQDNSSTTYFASGVAMFAFNVNPAQTLTINNIVNLGHSYIVESMINGNKSFTLYNSVLPKGQLLPFTDSTIIHDNRYLECAGPGCISQRVDFTYVKSQNKQMLLLTNSGTIQDIPIQWKLIKPIGDKPDLPEIKDKKTREFLSLFSPSFSNKLIFMAPKNKIMIYGDGQFYELTKKKIKEMGG